MAETKGAQHGKPKKSKGKDKAADRGFIPIPVRDDQDDSELSDEDLQLLEEYGGAAAFLDTLDEKGITRCVASHAPLPVEIEKRVAGVRRR